MLAEEPVGVCGRGMHPLGLFYHSTLEGGDCSRLGRREDGANSRLGTRLTTLTNNAAPHRMMSDWLMMDWTSPSLSKSPTCSGTQA